MRLCSEARRREPFGLTFNTSTVFASRYNSSGSVEITSFPILFESEYYTYYLKAIQIMNIKSNERLGANAYYNLAARLDAIAMFKDILDAVTTSLKQTLGHAPAYTTLFLPSVFEDRLRNAAVDTISLESSKQPTMYGPSQLAACHAFDFLGGQYLRRAPS